MDNRDKLSNRPSTDKKNTRLQGKGKEQQDSPEEREKQRSLQLQQHKKTKQMEGQVEGGNYKFHDIPSCYGIMQMVRNGEEKMLLYLRDDRVTGCKNRF